MLAQVVADKTQGLYHMIFYGIAGQFQLHGYFFVVEPLITA